MRSSSYRGVRETFGRTFAIRLAAAEPSLIVRPLSRAYTDERINFEVAALETLNTYVSLLERERQTQNENGRKAIDARLSELRRMRREEKLDLARKYLNPIPRDARELSKLLGQANQLLEVYRGDWVTVTD